MTRIRIHLDRVKNISENVKIMPMRVSNIHSELNILRSRIDPKILARNQIGSRMVKAQRDIEDIERRLRELFTFINQSTDKYIGLERYLMQQIQSINSRAPLVRPVSSSYPKVDGIDWSKLPDNVKPQLLSSIRQADLRKQFNDIEKGTLKNTPDISKYPHVPGLDWSKVPENMKQQLLDSIRHTERQKYEIDGIDWDHVSPNTKDHLRNSLDLAAQQRVNQHEVDPPMSTDDPITHASKEGNKVWNAVKKQATREWSALKYNHSSWERGLSYYTIGASDPIFTMSRAPMTSSEYWFAAGETTLNTASTFMGGTFVKQGASMMTSAVRAMTKGAGNAFQWTGKNFNQMGKNMSPNEMIKNFLEVGMD